MAGKKREKVLWHVGRIEKMLGVSEMFHIDYSGTPVRPRIFIKTPLGGTRDLSPRLTLDQIDIWLEGFIEALGLEYEIHHKMPDIPSGTVKVEEAEIF